MKRFILLALILGLLIGCTPQTEGTATETADDFAAPTDTAVAAPTATEVAAATTAPTEAATAVSTAAAASDLPAAPAIDSATTVAEAAEIRDTDWAVGAEDARIVIIEYGDFQ